MKTDYTLHEIKGHIESIYIAEYPDRLLLLDGGCRCDFGNIVEFVEKKLNRSMKDVSLTVITHSHPDHSAAAPFIRKEFNIPIAAHKDIDTWYSGMRGWLQKFFDTGMAWIVVFRTGQKFKRLWFARNITPDFPLSDGDALPFFPDWKAVHCPGHTNHDIALYNTRTRDLYLSDIVLEVNSRHIPPFPVTMPVLMRESLERLSKLDVSRGFLAHGGFIKKDINPQFFLSVIPYLDRKHTGMMKIIWPFTRFSKQIKR